jgi:sarcosine oxidase subunit beta
MRATADAVVVGGGVVGASVAFHLASLGLSHVLLCERRQTGAGASGASGAFIQFHFCRNIPETRLTQSSLPYFERWGEIVGAGSCGFVPSGYLRLEPAGREAILRQRVEMLRGAGVESQVVGPDDVARLAPYVRTDGVVVAAYEPGSGCADANGTIAGFIEAATRRGAEVRTDTTVTGIRVEHGRVTGVDTTGGPIDAPIVVVAAGAWSNPLFQSVGLDLPITGALTQCVVCDSTAPLPEMMTIGDGVSGSYFRQDGEQVLVGLGEVGRRPLADLDADAPPLPDDIPRTAQERLSARLKIPTAFRAVGDRTGPITITPDDLPIIDRHPEISGLTYFTGDGGACFKTAPAIGRALAEWAVPGQPESDDVSEFSNSRFIAQQT